VREIVLLDHLLRVRTSRPAEYGVNAEGLEAVVRTGLVVQHEGALLFDSKGNTPATIDLDRGGRRPDHLRFDCGGITIDEDLSLIGVEGQLAVPTQHHVNQEYLRYRREHYRVDA
jgi:hypothetical protein